MNSDDVSPVPVRRLWLAVLCGYLSLGATLQELPGYVVSRFHAGPTTAGLAVGLAFAATAAVRPFAGRAGDAGWSRPVVVAGAGLTALAALGHLLAPSVGELLAARLVMGAGEAALFSGALPWVLGGVPAGRGGRVAGWFGLSMWGGLAAGPVLAVLLGRAGGSSAVWAAVAALPVLSGLLVVSTGRVDGARRRAGGDPGEPGDAAGVSPCRRGTRRLLPRGAGLPGLLLGLSAYGYGTLAALVVLYLSTDGVGGQSGALAVFAVAFLVTRAAGSPLIDRFGGARVVRCVLGLEVLGLALLAAAGDAPVALGGTALTGVGVGLVYPAATVLTLGRTAARSPGLAVAAMTSLWDLGILAAGPAGGLLAAHLGYRQAFGAAALVAAVALLLGARIDGSAERGQLVRLRA